MSKALFLAVLLVLSVTVGPAFSQVASEDACSEGIGNCGTQLAYGLATGGQESIGTICKHVDNFITCIYAVDCPISDFQKQMIIDQAMVPFRAQGINCGGSPTLATATETGPGVESGIDHGAGGPGGESGIGHGAGGPGGESGIGHGAGGPGGESGIGHGVGGPGGESGIDHGVGGPGGESGIGHGAGGPGGESGIGHGAGGERPIWAIFAEVEALLSKYDCVPEPSTCADKAGDDPTCGDMREAGQCMFNECPAIRETGDDKKAAGLLVEFISATAQCEISVEELLGNGSTGVLERPVWASLTVLLATALVKQLLV